MNCSNCGTDNAKPASGWVGGRGKKNQMSAKRYVRSSCGRSYVAWTDSKKGKTKAMARK